jgi:hypothetical protein
MVLGMARRVKTSLENQKPQGTNVVLQFVSRHILPDLLYSKELILGTVRYCSCQRIRDSGI